MFDFAWSEIALIGVVALVLIGPKDMPVAIKAVSDMVRKARKMAGEFQSHVDEMTKDTGLAEVRQQINEIRNMDIRGEIAKAVDADGSIRSALADDPFRQMTPHAKPAETVAPEPEFPAETVTVPEAVTDAAGDAPALPSEEVASRPEHVFSAPAEPVPDDPTLPPAFIPPAPRPAPAFIPPSVAHARVTRPDAARV